MATGEKGFTILEVILFIAISGALLLMVLLGTGTMANRQKFTDSVESLQSYLQRQYDEVVSGVNTRSRGPMSGGAEVVAKCPGADSAPGTQENCFVLGRLITYDTTGTERTIVRSSYIISTEILDPSLANASDQEKLYRVQPAISTVGETEHELKWGAIVTAVTRSANPVSNPREAVRRIAFIRLPDSSRVVTLFYAGSPGDETTRLRGVLDPISGDLNMINPQSGTAVVGRMPSAIICIRNINDFGSSAPFAAIEFDQGNGAGTIDTNFAPEAHLCS